MLGLRADLDHPGTFSLTVERGVCGRTGFLHGGCSLAAAVTALEAITGRPLVWATGQFLGRAELGETVQYATTVTSQGNRLSQAQVEVRVGTMLVTRVAAALGGRPDVGQRQWPVMPEVPEPDACEPAEMSWEPDGSFHSTVEARSARLDRSAGRVALWARLPGGLHTTTAGLTVLGDYVPTAFRLVLDDLTSRASSLDITVRIVRPEPTGPEAPTEPPDWVLLDLALGTLAGGVGHGEVRVWSRSGRLLALSGQTFAFSS